MSEDRTYCVVCAWRADCKKKYAFESSGQHRCPDYSRDVTIPRDKKDQEEEEPKR